MTATTHIELAQFPILRYSVAPWTRRSLRKNSRKIGVASGPEWQKMIHGLLWTALRRPSLVPYNEAPLSPASEMQDEDTPPRRLLCASFVYYKTELNIYLEKGRLSLRGRPIMFSLYTYTAIQFRVGFCYRMFDSCVFAMFSFEALISSSL